MSKRKGKPPKSVFNFRKTGLVAAAKSARLSTKNSLESYANFDADKHRKRLLSNFYEVGRVLFARLAFFILQNNHPQINTDAHG